MKITAIVYSMNELMSVSPYIDAAIIMDEDLATIYGKFDIDTAIAYCEAHNIIAILGFNKIMHDKDLEILRLKLNILKNTSALFYISDLGAAKLLMDMNLNNRIIYNPETMITNFYDLMCYDDFNFNAVGMSLEIPVNDVLFANAKSKTPLIYQIFGHHIMFYSKRKLLTLYKEKASINIDGKVRYLKEEKREDFYPVIENKNGTFLFRPYQISLLDKLDELKQIEYGYFDSLYLDLNVYINVLKCYRNYLDNKITKDEALEILNNLNLYIEEGFTNNDSVYVKEEF